MFEMNREYFVKDSSHIGLVYKVWFEPSKEYDDLIIVHDGLYNDVYYMTEEEIDEEFTILKGGVMLC